MNYITLFCNCVTVQLGERLNFVTVAFGMINTKHTKTNAMKTFTISIIATCTFATSLFAASNEKFYQVTDNGQFQYTYWAEKGKENIKANIKPVTLRTFFLETEKNGLLPFAMSYSTFEKLTVEEKQVLLAGSQDDILTTMENTEAIVIEITARPSFMRRPVAAMERAEEPIEEQPAVKRVALDINAPWLIKAVTNLGTENDLPDSKVEITIESNNELPQTADLMLNEGEQTEARNVAEAVKTSKSLRVSK